MDIQMPELDGFEVCKILKKNEATKHIPIIMVTALYTNVKDKIKGLELGADAFLSKPIEEGELVAQINVMLRIKRAEDKLREENKNLESEIALRTKKLTEEIKERKVIEQNLKKAIEQAKESDRLKSAFLANLSHEIRTPMNGILGFTELLLEPDLPEDKKNNYIRVILDNGEQLLHLINDIIDISKIEAGLIDTKFEMFNVNDELDKIFQSYLLTANQKKLTLLLGKGLPDEKSFIKTDRTRFRQIINNLINNALKFTHEGEIEFGYEPDGKVLQFFVRDTGIGIAPELHEKIFERFKQVDDTISKNYGGTGLGLSIIKAYIEKLGGEIGLLSEPNEGSTFYFTLPYNENLIQFSQNTHRLSNNHDRKNYTILIAEDKETNFNYLKEILVNKNIQLIHARNGLEAIEYCSTTAKVDLILMDLRMPVMDGYKARKEINKLYPEIPIIAQTAFSKEEDKNKALDAGFHAYISKPIKSIELVDLIQLLITRKKSNLVAEQ